MTEVAFLVKVHNLPDMADRLIRRLDVPWARTIVHVDGKVDATPFRALSGTVANCSFVPDAQRVPVYWGGFSIAATTLLLGRIALAQMPEVRRVFILSGVDYPVLPLDRLRERLHTDREFVHVNRLLDPAARGVQETFIRRRYFGNNRWFNERDAPWRPAARAVALVARRIRPRLVPGFDIYHGSDWYGLSAEAMRSVLDFYDARPELLAAFRQVRSPTEMIVQSALMATGYGDRLGPAADPAGSPSSHQRHVRGSHYVDWTAGGSHPKTLVLEDYAAIVETGALFARKLHPERSRALLDALDARA